MLEDAFIMRDANSLTSLFQEGAVLRCGMREAHGPDEIAAVVTALWERDAQFVADVRRVVQAGDTALIFGRGTHVLNRTNGGPWRYVISILESVPTEGGESHA